MTPTTPSPIPEGWMLVPKAWQPIMDEIERRADKMSGDSRFTVEIDADDIGGINATPSPISDQAAGEPVTRQMLEAAKEYLPDYPYPGWAHDITGMYQAMRRVALNAAPCSHNYINGQCKTCGCVRAGE